MVSPPLDGAQGVRASAGLLIPRVYIGLAMAFAHGLGKLPPSEKFIEGVAEMGFPAPLVFAWAAAVAEFAGGLCLALGLLTRPSALFCLFTMIVAAFVRHGADPFQRKELALLYAAAFAIFVVIGPGRFSLDALFSRNEKTTA